MSDTFETEKSIEDAGFRPIGNRVLIRRHEGDKKTSAGLHLPNEKKSNLADLIAVGDGDRIGDVLPECVGSVVYFVEHPQQIVIAGGCLVVPVEAIMGVL